MQVIELIPTGLDVLVKQVGELKRIEKQHQPEKAVNLNEVDNNTVVEETEVKEIEQEVITDNQVYEVINVGSDVKDYTKGDLVLIHRRNRIAIEVIDGLYLTKLYSILGKVKINEGVQS